MYLLSWLCCCFIYIYFFTRKSNYMWRPKQKRLIYFRTYMNRNVSLIYEGRTNWVQICNEFVLCLNSNTFLISFFQIGSNFTTLITLNIWKFVMAKWPFYLWSSLLFFLNIISMFEYSNSRNGTNSIFEYCRTAFTLTFKYANQFSL